MFQLISVFRRVNENMCFVCGYEFFAFKKIHLNDLYFIWHEKSLDKQVKSSETKTMWWKAREEKN